MIAVEKKHADVCGEDLTCTLTIACVDGEDEMRYTTYGIKICNKAGEALLEQIDISTDRDYVQRFIDLCVARRVYLIHVMDVLDDYLA